MAAPPTTTSQASSTVLLIGDIGSGKSSLGNFLLGDAVFETQAIRCSVASTLMPSEFTSIIPTYGRTGKRDDVSHVRVVDTPGLGLNCITRLKTDLKPMLRLHQRLVDIGHLSFILLCIPFDSTLDQSTSGNLEFYLNLLLPLLQKGVGVMLCFTHVSQQVFADIKSGGAKQEAHHQRISSNVALLHKIGIINVVAIEFFGGLSQWQTDVDIQSDLDALQSDKSVLDHSVIARDRVLKLVCQTTPISVDVPLLFPLPPPLAANAAPAIQSLIKRMYTFVEAADGELPPGHAEMLLHVMLARRGLKGIDNQIAIMEAGIQLLSRKHRSSSTYWHSHSLFEQADEQVLPCNVPNTIIQTQRYDAGWEQVRQAHDAPYSVTLKVLPQPNDSTGFWFLVVCLEIDGLVAFDANIQEVASQLRVKRAERPIAKLDFENKLAAVKSAGSATEARVNQLQHYHDQLDSFIMNPKCRFRVEEVANAVRILEDNMIKQ